jgi:hypothetical protein
MVCILESSAIPQTHSSFLSVDVAMASNGLYRLIPAKPLLFQSSTRADHRCRVKPQIVVAED